MLQQLNWYSSFAPASSSEQSYVDLINLFILMQFMTPGAVRHKTDIDNDTIVFIIMVS